MTNGQEEQHSRYHNLRPFRDEAPHKVLRQWLNIIFMVGVIAGITCYYTVADRDIAIYILIGASAFKFVELSLRIIS